MLEAFGGAARRLSLSGTPFRSDTSAIPFVDYHLDEARADYEYGYGQALADRGVVRPVYFPRINGFMEWVAPDGEVLSATFDDELAREQANQRLRTALSLEGQWLPAVLDQAQERLVELRRHHPEAGGLVMPWTRPTRRTSPGCSVNVTASGRSPLPTTPTRPITSRRSASADPWIVAVRMVSEGVDILGCASRCSPRPPPPSCSSVRQSGGSCAGPRVCTVRGRGPSRPGSSCRTTLVCVATPPS